MVFVLGENWAAMLRAILASAVIIQISQNSIGTVKYYTDMSMCLEIYNFDYFVIDINLITQLHFEALL